MWGDRAVLLVDTGGFEAEGAEGLDEAVRGRSLTASTDAALVLYLLDGKAGLSAADEAAARELRRRGANVLFVVNKLDSAQREAGAGEFYRLGADDLLPVSAEHGHGIPTLIETILARVPEAAAGRRVRGDPRQHHRPPERRQVVAGEPPARLSARARARDRRHDARLPSTRCSRSGARDISSSIPPASAAVRGSTSGWRSSRPRRRWRRSAAPTSR